MKKVMIASALVVASASVGWATPLGTPYDAFLNFVVLPPTSPLLRVEVHESQPPNALFFTFDGIPEVFPFQVPTPESTPGKDLLVNESITVQETNTELLTFEFTAVDGGTLHLNPIPGGVSGAFGIVDLFWDGATVAPTIDNLELEVFQGATSSIIATTPSLTLGSGLPSDPLEIYYLPPITQFPDGITRLEFRMAVTHVPEPGWALWFGPGLMLLIDNVLQRRIGGRNSV